MEELEKYFKDNNLSPLTIKSYMRNLRLLNDNKNFTDLNFLSKKKDIDDFLESKKLNTKKNYYISIVSALSSESKKKKLYDYYHEKMMNLNKEVRANYSNNTKDSRENDNWKDWKDILTIKDDLLSKIESFKSKKKINATEYNTLLKGLILSLYTMIPPRRNGDYLDMFVGVDDDDSVNWCNMKSKKLIFNKYKTSKKEGQLIVDMPNDLYDIIKIYLKFKPNDTDSFLLFSDGKEFNVNSITYILNSATGKKIGSSLLRHIYLSSKYGDRLNEMKDDAKAMGHSLGMQKDYIKTD